MNMKEYFNTLSGTAELKRVHIDTIGGLCPNNCFMCPARYKKKPYPSRMKDEVFRKIIDDLAEMNYSQQLHFYTQCEPFIDVNIIDKVNYARERLPNAHLKIISNFIPLTDKKIDAILKLPLDELINSIYALNHEDYQKICRSKFYEKAMINQISFLKKFSRMENLPYQFRVYLIKMEENRHDDDFIEYFSKLLPCNIINRTHLLRFPHEFIKKTTQPTPKTCCDFIFSTLAIYSNGETTFCMADPDADFGRMGNVMDMSIRELINTREVRQRRKDIFLGKHPMCQDRCQYCAFAINHAELFWLPPSPLKTMLAKRLSARKGDTSGIVMDMQTNSVDEIHRKSDYFNSLFPDGAEKSWPDIINSMREDFKAGKLK